MPDMENGKKSRQFKKGAKASGDAANTFVRVILSYAGTLLGGITECERERTLDIFKHRCAYTGEKGNLVVDHAIPMNRYHCGLHLYGNLVPATNDANQQKKHKHYADFLGDSDLQKRKRKKRLDQFLCESGYLEKVAVFGDLRKYCESQYDTIRSLSDDSKRYLESLLPSPENEDPDKPENGGGQTTKKTITPSPVTAHSKSEVCKAVCLSLLKKPPILNDKIAQAVGTSEKLVQTGRRILTAAEQLPPSGRLNPVGKKICELLRQNSQRSDKDIAAEVQRVCKSKTSKDGVAQHRSWLKAAGLIPQK